MLALRYLNPLRNAFSVMTLICLLGVSLGVMVLIVVLSVMEGLQRDMADKVLTFTPHYVASATDETGQLIRMDDQEIDWQSALEKIAEHPQVVSVYPKLDSDAFIQSRVAGGSYRFQSVQPHNEQQMNYLRPLIARGSFDFGEGLDQLCVISSKLADALRVDVGDTVTLNPLGGLNEFEDVYRLIQQPMRTLENTEFISNISTLFESAKQTEQGYVVDAARVAKIKMMIEGFAPANLRQSEKEAVSTLYQLIYATELQNGLFKTDDRQHWEATVKTLKELDRHRENGKAIDSINKLSLPVDLEIIGVYQAPGNFPGPGLFIPLPIAQEVLQFAPEGRSQIHSLAIRVKDTYDAADLPDYVAEAISENITSDTAREHNWQVIPWTASLEEGFKLIANERKMMSFVLSIISLIAAFCIMAVMFTMSMQRKREIAVMQALGATPWMIMRIFVWQGLIIGFFGAVLGVVLALLVLHYRLEIQWVLASINLDPFPMEAHGITLPVHYNVATFVQQAVTAFVMVLVASIIPAYFVSRQDPSKALRSN